MSKLNGRQKRAIDRLAKALRPSEELAVALNECFEAATERANGAAERAEKAAERAQCAAERAEAAVARIETQLKPTLRMIWAQCKGDPNQRLPIDD